MNSRQTSLGALTAFGLGLAALPLATSGAGAAMQVITVSIEPQTKQACMQEVDTLRDKAKNIAGTALAVAHAQEAAEACEANKFEAAEEALADGYKWLGRKTGQGQ